MAEPEAHGARHAGQVHRPDEGAEDSLRERAERRLESRGLYTSEKLRSLPPERLTEELLIYQFELELQNEELRDAQQRLEVEHHRSVRLFDQAPGPYFVLDEDGVIRQVNRRGLDLLGRESDAVMGQSLGLFLSADGFAPFRNHVTDVLRHDRPCSMEADLTRPGGRVARVRLESAPFRPHPEQSYRGCLTAAFDVTELRHAEREAHEIRHRLEVALEATRAALWDWNIPDNRLVFTPRLPEALGASRRQVFTWEKVCHPADWPVVQEELQRFLDGPAGSNYRLVHRLRGPGESAPWVMSTGRVTQRDDQGLPVRMMGAVLDITERRQAERRHRRLEAKLQHAQKLESLGVLAGGIAHDFNNILTGVLGHAELLLRRGEGEPALRRSLEAIQREALRATELTNQMLAYSGKGSFVVGDVGLSDLVGEMASFLRASVPRGVDLEFDLAEPSPTVRGDASQLRQVLVNLVANAHEAVGDRPDGKVTVKTGQACISADTPEESPLGQDLPVGTYAVLEVVDNGCGMSEEDQTRAFDPFFTTKFTGRGLGLPAVSGIVRGHDGAIRIDSQPGRGARVRVLLPMQGAAPPTGEAQPDASPPAPPLGSDMPRLEGTVLVMDDEPAVRDVLQAALSVLGLRVRLARDGKEGLSLLSDAPEQIDLVLLDLTMPGPRPEEIFRQIRQLRPNLPVLICSGYPGERAQEQLGEYRPSGFLRKPLQLEDLSEAVAGALGG